MTAETSNALGEWPARYACNGPEGAFWTDDATLANKLIAAAFDRDEWTVTDTQNPTAAAPPPPISPVGVEEMQRRLDREESDHGRTINQRDAAEDALGRMFQAVTGRPAEWSSAWGYVDAIEEVEEHVAALAKHPAAVDEAMVERACRHWYSRWDEADQATKMLWAEMMYDLLAAALAPPPADPEPQPSRPSSRHSDASAWLR